VVRIATPDDAVALHQFCYPGTPIDTVRALLDPAEEIDRVVLVATASDDVTIGTCTLTRHQHRLERHRAEIRGFVIAPEHRGTGVARQLVQGCADYACMSWNAATLELAVRGGTHAEDAYPGLGFVEWARMPNGLQDEDRAYDDVRLSRPVNR